MHTITAKCSCCGREENYHLDEDEELTLMLYEVFGRDLGYIQDIFPKIPTWIRSGAIDKFSDGFCICPNCL